MACAAGPNTVEDGLILNIDPINLEKNLTSNTSTNFLQNGSFSGGLGVTYEAGSNPTNTIIELENPGDSQYVLRQNGNQPFSEGVPEYQMNIDGGAQGTLSASTQYVMSGWYATSDDYNGGDTMFHARAFSTGGSHNATGNGIGTLLYSKVVGGLTWEFRYQTITTPSDYSGDFDWYMGYGTQNTAGYRYYTGLKVEEGSFPSALDLSRNGNEGKVKGATFNSDGYFDFDGTNDDVIDTGTSFLKTNDNVTLEAFFNHDSNSGSFFFLYEGEGDGFGGNVEFHLYASSGYLQSFFVTSSGDFSLGGSGVSAAAITAGEWNHAAVTYSNLSTASGASSKLYLNGVEIDSGSGATLDLASMPTSNLLIGRPYSTSLGRRYDGQVAAVKVYNRTLSASEIKQNFNALRGRFGI